VPGLNIYVRHGGASHSPRQGGDRRTAAARLRHQALDGPSDALVGSMVRARSQGVRADLIETRSAQPIAHGPASLNPRLAPPSGFRRSGSRSAQPAHLGNGILPPSGGFPGSEIIRHYKTLVGPNTVCDGYLAVLSAIFVKTRPRVCCASQGVLVPRAGSWLGPRRIQDGLIPSNVERVMIAKTKPAMRAKSKLR
jgi:hypothetical protein